jgi:hypothetical protein
MEGIKLFARRSLIAKIAHLIFNGGAISLIETGGNPKKRGGKKPISKCGSETKAS